MGKLANLQEFNLIPPQFGCHKLKRLEWKLSRVSQGFWSNSALIITQWEEVFFSTYNLYNLYISPNHQPSLLFVFYLPYHRNAESTYRFSLVFVFIVAYVTSVQGSSWREGKCSEKGLAFCHRWEDEKWCSEGSLNNASTKWKFLIVWQNTAQWMMISQEVRILQL